MKNLNSKGVFAALLFAGLSLVSCKDRSSETEGGDTTGTEATGGSYESPDNTGEAGNDGMSPGADGGTGLVNDSTSTNGSTPADSPSGNGGNGGNSSGGTGNGTTTQP